MDPNRAFDIVLNALQVNKAREIELVQLLDPVSSKCLANLLGFKYQQLENDEPTPEGLLRVTALLLGQKRIFLSEIYPYVSYSFHFLSYSFAHEFFMERKFRLESFTFLYNCLHFFEPYIWIWNCFLQTWM